MLPGLNFKSPLWHSIANHNFKNVSQRTNNITILQSLNLQFAHDSPLYVADNQFTISLLAICTFSFHNSQFTISVVHCRPPIHNFLINSLYFIACCPDCLSYFLNYYQFTILNLQNYKTQFTICQSKNTQFAIINLKIPNSATDWNISPNQQPFGQVLLVESLKDILVMDEAEWETVHYQWWRWWWPSTTSSRARRGRSWPKNTTF